MGNVTLLFEKTPLPKQMTRSGLLYKYVPPKVWKKFCRFFWDRLNHVVCKIPNELPFPPSHSYISIFFWGKGLFLFNLQISDIVFVCSFISYMIGHTIMMVSYFFLRVYFEENSTNWFLNLGLLTILAFWWNIYIFSILFFLPTPYVQNNTRFCFKQIYSNLTKS